ncbi:DUF2057 domain-containing protein [Vibrio sp. Hep-1b-8]|uniref:DUF2057 domain-containing protein n=1 Tax=Vibrio sp. Hep-1b-8 TaxID=2144187 RepID=UPI0011104C69|nr:DUF2057 domain-containing protein [Vibrio sp. Hep-1b-8]TMX31876.1 DUF2057 domain-containing protein [Vibrio sp. Hep-1b-8]
MNKALLISFPFVLVGCTTLDANSDFSDAVKRIESKQTYQIVTGKTLTPETIDIQGGQLVKSTLEFNYVAPYENQSAPASFITMELQYFKNYSQFSYVNFSENNLKVDLESYAASAETCSDICTTTQYLKFPVDQSLFMESLGEDLVFDVAASKNSIFTFSVPAKYIEALVKSGSNGALANKKVASSPAIVTNQATDFEPQSKALEMSQYWFEQMKADEQQKAVNWAVANRSESNTELFGKSKEAEMFGYWYEKADREERKAIIKKLLDL